MVTSEWQQAKFYSLEIMGHLTQVGWTRGGQARKSEMKIKALGGGGQCIQNGLEPRARSRDERGTLRGGNYYLTFRPNPRVPNLNVQWTKLSLTYITLNKTK